jgi:hypothetical protein
MHFVLSDYLKEVEFFENHPALGSKIHAMKKQQSAN